MEELKKEIDDLKKDVESFKHIKEENEAQLNSLTSDLNKSKYKNKAT